MFLILLVSGSLVSAQSTNLKLQAIPFKLEVLNEPVAVYTVKGDSLLLSAKGKTNLFASPSGHYNVQNAPMVLFHPDSSFVFCAKVGADLKAVYDVAALVFYQDSDYWGKFCFENSVNKQTSIVSVINRIYSDDCNSMHIDDDYAYMAIIKKGLEMSFHYSRDGKNWEMIRNFRLETEESLKIGFAVHGSRGDGTQGQFSNIRYSSRVPDDLRSF